MTDDNRAFLQRINEYAEEVLGDIDPQKTQVSIQLDKLKPLMEQIAKEEQTTVEDIFIRYMDVASDFAALNEQEFQSDLGI
ncbi:MAG: hypothetical protein R3Y67_09240 [Eubacteriales bacterium]